MYNQSPEENGHEPSQAAEEEEPGQPHVDGAVVLVEEADDHHGGVHGEREVDDVRDGFGEHRDLPPPPRLPHFFGFRSVPNSRTRSPNTDLIYFVCLYRTYICSVS